MSDKKNKYSRREILLSAMAAGGGVGLRSLLMGLPVHFLTQRSMAAPIENFLVYSLNGSGCPINCNVPGTYINGYDHATAFATPVTSNWGSQSLKAAPCWNSLKKEIKATANIFHLRTMTNSHNEMDKVTNIFGAIESIDGRSAEMLPSIIAHELAPSLGTRLSYPVALAGPLTHKGKNQKIYTPSSVKALFPSGESSATINARVFRDKQIDLLYKDVKSNGTPAQMRFLNNYASSSKEAQELANQLSEALQIVEGDTEIDHMKTAAALLALKLTPVVTVRMHFGGDNHADTDLAGEVAAHNRAMTSLNALYDALKGFGIQNKTTFALLNVFGRTIKTNSRGGRDHNHRQSVMFSFGAGVKGGMIGDLAPGFRGLPEAQPINSTTGKITSSDIPINETLHSAAKSLMVATGMSEARTNKLVTGGKIVKPYLA